MSQSTAVIREISMRNLLSFGDEETRLTLGPLTVLVGPNGCGKSNLLEVFYLLSRLPVSGPDASLPILDWMWKGAPNSAHASVEVVVDRISLDNATYRHQFSFDALHGWFTFHDERIFDPNGAMEYIGGRNHRAAQNSEPGKAFSDTLSFEHSIIAQYTDVEKYPSTWYLRKNYQRIRVYRDISFGPKSPTRQPQRADLPTRFLLEDGSNLGLILNRLNANVATQRRLIELLKRFYPPAERVDVQVQGGTLQIFITEPNWITPATRLSDGTMRWLTLLAILLDPEPPKVVCLDEPDLGLHPDMMPALADLLTEASERMQVIITTHSDALVDAFSDRPECIVVCEKEMGRTTLKRLDADALKVWLKDYSLGELWTSGQIGGRRF